MSWFSPRRNPFGLTEHDELGALPSADADAEVMEAVSRRGTQQVRAGSVVGNGIRTSRYRTAAVLLTLAFGLLLSRALWLQVVNGETYRALADANRTRSIILPAERGVIVDRNGIALATNIPSFVLVGAKTLYLDALPGELPTDAAEREDVFARAAALVGADAVDIAARYDEAAQGETFIAVDAVSYEDALAFVVHDDELRGIDLVLSPQRSYMTTDIPTLSHVLGYTGIVNETEYESLRGKGYMRYDHVGKQGIEAQYEAQLRGAFGKEVVEVDARGRYLRTISKQDPVNGERLVLSIDAQLQEYIELVVEAKLAGQTATRAAVVAMDPATGEILALTSWPAYDANLFAQGIDQASYDALLNDDDHPLFPRATAGEYPSGSVMKPVYAAAALTEGIVTPQTSFVSTGGLQVGNRFFPDWRAGGHGVTNIYHAIADSVNTYFYIIGGGYDTFQGLGIDRLMSWASTFGFGAKSGLDVPGEGEGFLPSKAWKESEKGEPWYIGDTYNVAIGQGDFLATPVQVARATAVFANGGNLVTPHLEKDAAVTSTTVVTPDVTAIVKDAMRQTVTNGSATSLQSVPVAIAGKTGTAQWSHSAPPHSWFTGFGPFDDPSLVITVLVEDGGDQALAIPIAREILTWYFDPSRNPVPEEG